MGTLAPSAVAVFEEAFARIEKYPELCLDPAAIRVAQLVLDRVGLGPSMTVHPGAPAHDADALVNELTDEEFAIVDPIMRAAMARLEAKQKVEDAALLALEAIQTEAKTIEPGPLPSASVPVREG
jgi:hypothetical protein